MNHFTSKHSEWIFLQINDLIMTKFYNTSGIPLLFFCRDSSPATSLGWSYVLKTLKTFPFVFSWLSNGKILKWQPSCTYSFTQCLYICTSFCFFTLLLWLLNILELPLGSKLFSDFPRAPQPGGLKPASWWRMIIMIS